MNGTDVYECRVDAGAAGYLSPVGEMWEADDCRDAAMRAGAHYLSGHGADVIEVKPQFPEANIWLVRGWKTSRHTGERKFAGDVQVQVTRRAFRPGMVVR